MSSVRTVVLAALAILALAAYWYFTRQPLTGQIRWTGRWIWTMPWAIPSFFDGITALAICACVFFFWREKKNSLHADSEEADMFFGLMLSMGIGATIGLFIVIFALYNSASAPTLIAKPVVSAIISLFLGFLWYGPEQDIWEDGFKTSFKLALYEIKQEIPVLALGLGLGAATPILLTFGTLPAIALILMGIIMVPISALAGTLANFSLQLLLGPTTGRDWFTNQGTGGF